ncbi:hypothetical protein [Yinghuangia soli]|uniref:Uncharacterized protein n=1 Tax=Yinghuangia soli TaxID=2908204 RepID=A0AA41Q2J9_9ACTN|nr:hypothetical protein [Yinghuangia soli]MCF2529254.1 hypothetical protein [Yinghuangia soli]
MSRWQAEDEQAAIADMSAAAYHDAADGHPHFREEVRRWFAEDAARPGFAVAGWAECAYG